MSVVYVCKSKGGGGGVWGHAPPKLDALRLLLRPFWDRSRAVVALSIHYIARRVLYPIFGCPCMHLLSQLTSNFHDRRYNS